MWKTTTTKKERRGNFKSVAHQLGLFVMIIDTLPISSIKLNPNNPRLVKDDKFIKLVKSIQDFPQMLKIRPIVVNDDNIVLGGNMRLKACKEAGHQLGRKVYAMEIKPEYCQITIDRMLKLDPSLEIKRNGQPYKTVAKQ